MAGTAAQLGNFQDPYQSVDMNLSGDFNTYTQSGSDLLGKKPTSAGEKLSDWLGFTDYQGAYDRWLVQQDRNYERASINSARAWEEYLDSTKYQRAVADLKKAGLNPWLAVQSGVSASAQGSSTDTGGSSSKQVGENKGFDPKIFAAFLLATAKLIMG